MSLNWREVNAILRDAALCGKRIGDVAQPDFEQLLLLVHDEAAGKQARGKVLRISHQAHRVVLHLSGMDMPAVATPIPRFMQLARARLRGGIISGCAQYSDQRIVRIAIDNNGQCLALWIRLWSGAANTLLTDEHDTIIDAYFRRPQAGEVSGGDARALIWARLGKNREQLREPYPCEPREHPYPSYSEMVDERYREEDQNRARKLLVEQVEQAADEQLRRLAASSGIASADTITEAQDGDETAAAADAAVPAETAADAAAASMPAVAAAETPAAADATAAGDKAPAPRGRAVRADELQAIALLLQREGYRVPAGATEVVLADPTSGVERTIALDPQHSVQQNAQHYFEKYKERRRAEERLAAQATETAAAVAKLVQIKAAALQMSTDALRATLKRLIGGKLSQTAQRADSSKRGAVLGRRFYSHGFTIIVGKSAAESDQLMRKTVRGNDMWFHARGVTGSSVFIRHRKGKSVPLDVLYDAATLAHHFSKARGNAHIDAFYTEVKHLRRAKHAPQGTFIPFHDHGLILDFDKQRLEHLQQSRTYDTL